jgi:hypothetical protein
MGGNEKCGELESRKSKNTKGERIDFELRFKIPMEATRCLYYDEAISTTETSEMGL